MAAEANAYDNDVKIDHVFTLEEVQSAGTGLHCLFLDTSRLSSNTVKNPPFFAKNAILRHFNSESDFVHIGAQDGNPHIFVSTPKETLISKIKAFFDILVDRSKGPQLDRVRYKLHDTQMIHREHLLELLEKFGEVRHLALHKPIKGENVAAGHFARSATAVLLLPHGQTLPEKIFFKYGPMMCFVTTEVHNDQDETGGKKEKTQTHTPNPQT